MNVSANIEVENTLDLVMHKFVNSSYQIKDSGGFVITYSVVEDEKEIQKEQELTLGDITDFTYLHHGKIMYLNIGNGVEIAWNEDNVKYILSEIDKSYIIVNQNTDPYYRNFLGQHILQDLINDYLKNKNRVTEIDKYTWEWDWTFYTPANNYQSKDILNTKIFINEETNFIHKIELYKEENKIGSFNFEFEETIPTEDSYIPSTYVFVEESKFNIPKK